MFRATLHLPVETPDHLFVAPVDMDTIESFMNHIGYQGVVDKVSALYTKNLAQPWQTMFKVFNRCLTTRTSGHDQTKINILQLFHVVINRCHVDYAALLRDEPYHSIKDDVPLISVYTTGNVRVKGMLIPDELLTDDICATDDFKEYKAVFENIVGPMTQPQPVVSTQGSNKTTPRANRTPTLSANLAGQSNESYDDIHIQDDRIEPGSHKNIPKKVSDDDTQGELTGRQETRTEKMQTPTPTLPRSPRKHLSSDKDISHELTA
ncbi:hypothetical protein Tco_0096990 [Tanacetum coccineum]